MNGNITTSELIDRLVMHSGIKKKLAADLLRAIPEIIEEGLKNEGEVRVKDFGTFRMKWTRGRTGRNPKTGETVEIPPHNRLVFLPEQSFKEFVNQDNRLLSYKVIPAAEEVQSEEFKVQSEVPEVQSEKIAAPNLEPGIWNLEPETRSLEPGTRSLEPETRSQEPETPEEEIDYSYEPEPEQPVRRRRSVHWIVPVAITVIAVLCVVFYFRNFNPVFKKSEERRQKAYIVTKEDRSQKSEDSVGGQQSAISGQQSAVGGQQSAVGGQQSAVGSQQSAVSSQQSAVSSQQSAVSSQQSAVSSKVETQNSELKTQTQNSTLKTQNSEGKHLFQIAREVYGNPFLWVLIYKENIDKIPAPDVVIAGKELVIPALEGKPRKLTHNDSLNVADGYRMVYEYYLDKGDPKADGFKQTYLSYKPR